MPYILEINRQTLVLDDADAPRILAELVRMTRIQIWGRAGGPDSLFQSYYRIWEHHNRYHSVNLFLWAVEALGGATLPPANRTSTLRRLNRSLNSSLTPRRIGRFFEDFGEYNRRQRIFVRDMRRYMDRVIGGTGTLITIAEVTRDASFLTLSACATVLTAGAAPAAEVAAVTAGRALLQSAASSFLITQIEHSATNLGRTMAGETVTYRETGDEIISDAVSSLSDAMLGEVVGHFLGPLTDGLTNMAEREIARGNLVGGMSLAITDTALGNAITTSINDMVRRAPGTIRSLLEACRGARTPRAYATIFAEGFMRDRVFRRILEEQIQASAGR